MLKEETPETKTPDAFKAEVTATINCFLEAIFWALGAFSILQACVVVMSKFGLYPDLQRAHAVGRTPLGPVDSLEWWNNIARLGIGSGIIEEFVFRVLLLFGLLWLLTWVMKPRAAWWTAAMLQAVLFAMAHGPQHPGVWTLRAVIGLALAVQLSYRGYLVTALTHGFYNFYILILIRTLVMER